MRKFDVVIIGGGIVGLTLACALGNSSLQVLVVDAQPPVGETGQAPADIRVSAIAAGTQSYLQQLGAWQHVPSARLGHFTHMHVWDAAGTGELHFAAESIQQANLGYIVANRLLQVALHKQLLSFPNIELLNATQLTELQRQEQGIQLSLSHGPMLYTQLLVGADGAESLVRQHAGMAACEHAYGQTALVTTVYTKLPHRNTAWQRFLPTGPLAFLPLADPHQCSIVWSTTPTQAEQLLALDASEFAEQLAQAFAYRLGVIAPISAPRATFSLIRRHAYRYVDKHTALIGDAIHTIHPLAGQGANLGIQDARALAEVILTAHQRQRAIGALYTLRRYERARKSNNLMMLSTIELIKRLFSNDNLALAWLRNRGLNLTNQIDMLKECLMLKAMG